MKCRRFIRQMTISVGRDMTLQSITDTDQIRGWTGLGSLTNFQRQLWHQICLPIRSGDQLFTRL